MEKYLKPTNIKDELPDKDGYYFIDNLNQLAICNLYFYTLTSRWYYDSSLYDEANEENFVIWYKPVLL